MAQRYSLHIDQIQPEINIFFENLPIKYSFSIESQNGQLILEVRDLGIFKKKERGILRVFFSHGLTSYEIQGSSSKHQNVCRQCWQHILAHCQIPLPNRKSMTITGVTTTSYDAFVTMLQDEGYDVLNKLRPHRSDFCRSHSVQDEQGATIALTLYNTGTLLIQGRVTLLMVDVCAIADSLLGDSCLDNVKELLEVDTKLSQEIFSLDISTYFEKYEIIRGTLIERMLLTSFELVNSGVVVHDYSCYSFGALRALEGVLKMIISSHVGAFTNFQNYFVYNSSQREYICTDTLKSWIADASLETSLKNAYSFYHKHRHSTFHTDSQIETSRILSISDAIEIIKSTNDFINVLLNRYE